MTEIYALLDQLTELNDDLKSPAVTDSPLHERQTIDFFYDHHNVLLFLDFLLFSTPSSRAVVHFQEEACKARLARLVEGDPSSGPVR